MTRNDTSSLTATETPNLNKSMNPLRFFILLAFLLGSPFLQAKESKLVAGEVFVLRLSSAPLLDQQNVSGHYTISNAGTVKLPCLKSEIVAASLTPTELMKKIEDAYKNEDIYNDPNVTIITPCAQTPSNVITVGEEVRSPGDIPIRPGINLFAAIAKCGGPTEYADMRRVRLMRGKTEKIYDLRKITNDNNPELQTYDQVIVPGI